MPKTFKIFFSPRLIFWTFFILKIILFRRASCIKSFCFPFIFPSSFQSILSMLFFFSLNQRNNNQKPLSTVRIKNGGIGSRILTDVSVGCCYLDLYVLVDNLFLPLGRIFFSWCLLEYGARFYYLLISCEYNCSVM